MNQESVLVSHRMIPTAKSNRPSGVGACDEHPPVRDVHHDHRHEWPGRTRTDQVGDQQYQLGEEEEHPKECQNPRRRFRPVDLEPHRVVIHRSQAEGRIAVRESGEPPVHPVIPSLDAQHETEQAGWIAACYEHSQVTYPDDNGGNQAQDRDDDQVGDQQ